MTVNPHLAAADQISEASPPPMWRRRWFIPAAAAGILLGLGVLAIGLFAFVLWQRQSLAQRKVAAEVARIQAAGEPITIEDFYAWHRVPAGTPDLTSEWLNILAMVDNDFGGTAKSIPIVGQGDASLLRADASGSTLAEAEAFLANNQAAITATHAVARQAGECRFPVQFEAGIGALLPHAQNMRAVSRLLTLDMHVRRERGDTAGALQSLDAIFAAGQTLKDQPTIVEQLVRIAVLGSALRNAERMLNEEELSDEQLAALAARIETIDAGAGMTNGLLGERGMSYHTFHHLELLGDEMGPHIGASNGKLTRPQDCLLTLQYGKDFIAASREPFPASLQAIRVVEDRLKKQVGEASVLDKLNYTITFLMLPATGVAFDATARLQAQRELLLAAIAAERFRQQTGAWPMQLADLAPAYLPAVPADPYDGKPLRMKVAGDELVLYSVGKNGSDDGGQEIEQKAEPDIVVRLRATKMK